MVPQWVIEKKRDGGALDEADIRAFIAGYTEGTIPDYQMAALAMAIYFQGMDGDEVAVLTDAMMRSGEVIDTATIARPKADKHSTGGIGDKVSLVLAPLVACCDVAVPMLSGRGLGITGGTLDKLESIPGYRTDLDVAGFLAVLKACGCSIIGQTEHVAPADRKLYALRDVTGTVPSIPLIAASIMSKKLAEGTDALVLDVKWGAGAFMKTPEQAAELARVMVTIGTRLGKQMSALLTGMNQPLGRAAGNAVEVVEALAALRGEGPPDLMEVTLALGAEMLVLTGRAADTGEAQDRLRAHIDSGAALERFRRMVELQGGDTGIVDDPGRLPRAPLVRPLPAPRGGHVSRVNADRLGRACLALGAGRRRVEDAVDHAVGLTDIVKLGEAVDPDRPLCNLHARDEATLAAAVELAGDAFTIDDGKPSVPPLIGERIP